MADEEARNDDIDRQRSTRFSTLPARVHPDDTIAMVETDPPHGRPEPAGTEEQRQTFTAGG